MPKQEINVVDLTGGGACGGGAQSLDSQESALVLTEYGPVRLHNISPEQAILAQQNLKTRRDNTPHTTIVDGQVIFVYPSEILEIIS